MHNVSVPSPRAWLRPIVAAVSLAVVLAQAAPVLADTVSNNLDATVEWYYADRSLFSVGAFSMDIDNYVALDRQRQEFLTIDSLHPAPGAWCASLGFWLPCVRPDREIFVPFERTHSFVLPAPEVSLALEEW